MSPASGEATNRGADRGLKLLLGITTGGAESSPAATYMALATSAILEGDTLASIASGSKEVVESGYARKQATFGSPADDGGIQKVKNTSSITFGPFNTGGTAITHAFIADVVSGTAGDCLVRFTLAATKYTNAGESLTVNVNDLQVGLE